MSKLNKKQAGGTLLGLIFGLIIGLAIAVVVAIMITKTPTPFTNKTAKTDKAPDAITTPAATPAPAPSNPDQLPDPNKSLYGNKDAAKEAATEAVVATVSRVLRLPAEDVSLHRPLSEVGVDSLMATELALSLEERFGLEMPFSASASGLSVSGLVSQIIGFAGGTPTGNGSGDAPAPVAQALAQRHLENASDEALASLSRIVEQAGQKTGELS